MNPVIWLVVGALLGWLATVELGPVKPLGRIVNVLAGACGALAAGWLLSISVGSDVVASGEFSIGHLVEAAFGAVVLLALVNLARFGPFS